MTADLRYDQDSGGQDSESLLYTLLEDHTVAVMGDPSFEALYESMQCDPSFKRVESQIRATTKPVHLLPVASPQKAFRSPISKLIILEKIKNSPIKPTARTADSISSLTSPASVCSSHLTSPPPHKRLISSDASFTSRSESSDECLGNELKPREKKHILPAGPAPVNPSTRVRGVNEILQALKSPCPHPDRVTSALHPSSDETKQSQLASPHHHITTEEDSGTEDEKVAPVIEAGDIVEPSTFPMRRSTRRTAANTDKTVPSKQDTEHEYRDEKTKEQELETENKQHEAVVTETQDTVEQQHSHHKKNMHHRRKKQVQNDRVESEVTRVQTRRSSRQRQPTKSQPQVTAIQDKAQRGSVPEGQPSTSTEASSAVSLEEWSLDISRHGRVRLYGHRRGDAADSFWSTSSIKERLEEKLVATYKGTCYRLQGDLQASDSHLNGVPRSVCNKFRSGFPENWKEVIENCAQHSKLRNKEKRKDRDVSKKVNRTGPKKTPEPKVLYVDDLPRTRSGRKVYPPLAHWANQRLSYCGFSQSVEFVSGSEDTFSLPPSTTKTKTKITKRRSSTKTISRKKQENEGKNSQDEEEKTETEDDVAGEVMRERGEGLWRDHVEDADDDNLERGVMSVIEQNRQRRRTKTTRLRTPCYNTLPDSPTDIENIPGNSGIRDSEPPLDVLITKERPPSKPRVKKSYVALNGLDSVPTDVLALSPQCENSTPKNNTPKIVNNGRYTAKKDLTQRQWDDNGVVEAVRNGRSVRSDPLKDTSNTVNGRSKTVSSSSTAKGRSETAKDHGTVKGRNKTVHDSGNIKGRGKTADGIDNTARGRSKTVNDRSNAVRGRSVAMKGRNVAEAGDTVQDHGETTKSRGALTGRGDSMESVDPMTDTVSKVKERSSSAKPSDDAVKGRPRSKPTKKSDSDQARPNCKSSNKNKTQTGAVTGGRGTMKRSRQVRQLVAEQEAGHTDDFFDATPFKNTKKVPLHLSDGSLVMDCTDGMGSAFKTPRIDNGVSYSYETPVCGEPSPGLLHTVDRNAADKVVYQMRKKAGNKRMLMAVTPTTTRPTKSYSPLPDEHQLFDAKMLSDYDSSEDDLYFSDN